ncbi:MAG: translation elongation factor Ts [Spirochaetaceae bacterium]|jgi:elongation factor Ts|nr:translation elongation factor Ts [Spirochaetaceae bacterium]
MAAISAADVKALREKTGAGMMECKNALSASDGDFAKAEKLLKEKGLAAVEKRADRATNEGKIFVKTKDGVSVLLELASETDFVARNPEFIALGGVIAGTVLEKGYTESDLSPDGKVFGELNGLVTALAVKIRENMSLKRVKVIKAASNEYLSQYIHGDGNIGVVVKAAADKGGVFEKDEVKEFIFTLALHIAAFNPMALDRNSIDPAYLKEQEDIFRKQMEQDEKIKGKPANVIDGILKGKINKYLSDICLLEQGYVKDEKIPVAKALENLGKQAGAVITVKEFAYFKVGN